MASHTTPSGKIEALQLKNKSRYCLLNFNCNLFKDFKDIHSKNVEKAKIYRRSKLGTKVENSRNVKTSK